MPCYSFYNNLFLPSFLCYCYYFYYYFLKGRKSSSKVTKNKTVSKAWLFSIRVILPCEVNFYPFLPFLLFEKNDSLYFIKHTRSCRLLVSISVLDIMYFIYLIRYSFCVLYFVFKDDWNWALNSHMEMQHEHALCKK